MTAPRGIQKLIQHYDVLLKQGYENISIHQVINDLRGVQRMRR